MTGLTEQWEKGKLKKGKIYYCRTKYFEDILEAACNNEGQNDEWWALKNEKYSFNNIYHLKDVEVLAEVPSYDEWQHLQNSFEHEKIRSRHYYKVLTEMEDKNEKLEKLLKECKTHLENAKPALWNFPETETLLAHINAALGENEEQ